MVKREELKMEDCYKGFNVLLCGKSLLEERRGGCYKGEGCYKGDCCYRAVGCYVGRVCYIGGCYCKDKCYHISTVQLTSPYLHLHLAQKKMQF